MKNCSFLSRPLRLSDAQEYANTGTAIGASSGTHARYSAEETLQSWQEPNFDIEQFSLGLFTEDGKLAAYAILWANAGTPVRPWLQWGVHPDNHSDNLTHKLFEWVDEKGREAMDRCPPETRVSLQAETPVGYAFDENALVAAGFVADRAAYDMRIEMAERPACPGLPDGFTFRQYHHEDDLPLLVETVRDTFSDHFGYVEPPFEEELAEFRHWLGDNPHFDPSLVRLVVHEPSNIVAGCLLGLTKNPYHPGIGFIDIVGVRRDFRRRGLAQVMLHHNFADYWDLGLRTVSLSVDGESLTNAVALYEKVGMHIHRRHMSYEKVLRDGVELATVALE